jgi:hypothetical protein
LRHGIGRVACKLMAGDGNPGRNCIGRRCEGRNEHGRSTTRFHRCRSRDTERVRVGRFFFDLCPAHRWALLDAMEAAKKSEARQKIHREFICEICCTEKDATLACFFCRRRCCVGCVKFLRNFALCRYCAKSSPAKLAALARDMIRAKAVRCVG